MAKLKDGWGIDSAATLQSGQPFTLNYNFEDDYSGGGDGFDRPDVVGPIVYNKNNPANFLQLNSFAMPCSMRPGITNSTLSGFASDCAPGTRHYGNLGRNCPERSHLQTVGYRHLQRHGAHRAPDHAASGGLLQHSESPELLQPRAARLSSPIRRPISSRRSDRAEVARCGFVPPNGATQEVGNGAYQITATGDVGIGNPFLGGGGPRGIQLAAKFTF